MIGPRSGKKFGLPGRRRETATSTAEQVEEEVIMSKQRQVDPEMVAALARLAGLDVDKARLQVLAERLPAFRERVERLRATDVTELEFDFLHPLR